ncbi:actin cytoskeleton-regulatory complex protein PAN1-like [Amphibalanus amphitrite]|uniref:actin cytoskeleton-regulatory complex protein PAN1-like n=1 Tax=Amphibalanus amphitrite TaxID=1232801 RepID=UPI001C909375|nr:actin cytoskeleton-regulatory complex protein PAN1-like [Amphibalanus amphitrite]
MEGSGAGADRPSGAAERDRRGVYLEDVAKEFDSWLFWRDEAGAVGPEPAQQPGFQVVTARRVHLAETARLAAPEAQRAPCRIPSPTDQLLAESRQRLRGSSAAAAAASVVSDSGIACGASTADEASDLEEDWSVQSGHEMGNKMGTATPERRKTRIMAIKDAGRKKRLGGSSSSSAEILDTVPPRTEQPVAPADRADVPERVARFPRPGPDSPVKAPPHQASAQPQPVPQQPQPQQPQPQQPPAEATNSFVTDSWKQVRRLQEGCDAAAGVASDESSGSFTDPLSSSRAGARSGTSNTMRQDADPDTATLTDALVAAELPMDDTPVRRHDEPLHPDSIELSVDERFSVDLTRSCEPSMLQSLLSDATPVAEDRARSFSQADVNEGGSPRPSTRPTFTVTKHRKVDLGGRLSQTAPGLEHTTSEHCLPVGPSCGREAGMQWLVVLTAALAVGGAQPPPAEPVYAGLTRDQVIVALKAAFATLSAEERAVPSVAQVAAGPEIGPDAGPGAAEVPAAAAAPSETANPVEQSETVPETASSPEPPAEVPGGQSEPDPVPPTGADDTAPSRAPIVVPEEYYPSTFSHPFPPGFFSLYKIPNESEAPSAGSV